MNTPFKMKGFSGFGNSPIKQNKSATEKLGKSIKEGGAKGYFKTVLKNPTLLPKAFGESLKYGYQKYIRKDPRGKLSKKYGHQ